RVPAAPPGWRRRTAYPLWSTRHPANRIHPPFRPGGQDGRGPPRRTGRAGGARRPHGRHRRCRRRAAGSVPRWTGPRLRNMVRVWAYVSGVALRLRAWPDREVARPGRRVKGGRSAVAPHRAPPLTPRGWVVYARSTTIQADVGSIDAGIAH